MGLTTVGLSIFPTLQRSIDEKFHSLEEKEEEVRQLQLSLREKERDMDRLRCVLSNNEDTITVRTIHCARERHTQ